MSSVFYIFKLFLLCLLCIPNRSQANLYTNQHKPLILLFHGLGNNAASFDTMKQGLEHAFPTASVVALTGVEGMKSINLSISEQSEASFNELLGKVSHLDLNEQSETSLNELLDKVSHLDLNEQSKASLKKLLGKTHLDAGVPILLVGHSQGGLRAYAFLKKYGNLLNIKGLVTLAAPWEGAPGARVNAAMLSQYLIDPVLDDLRILSLSLGYAKNDLEGQLRLNVQANQAVCLCPGGKDLMKHSAFLGQVKEWLLDEKVPILAIGGGQSDFSAFLTKKGTHRFRALNKAYTFFVVGGKDFNSHHDMQVPLSSQHALHIVPKSKKNFKRVFIKDAFHGAYVWEIPVPKSKVVLSHPRVLHSVIKFAKSIFK